MNEDRVHLEFLFLAHLPFSTDWRTSQLLISLDIRQSVVIILLTFLSTANLCSQIEPNLVEGCLGMRRFRITFEQISLHGLLFPRPNCPKCKVCCSRNAFTIQNEEWKCTKQHCGVNIHFVPVNAPGTIWSIPWRSNLAYHSNM